MKVYIQAVSEEFQPDAIAQPYPQYNSQYGVEQDIVVYLEEHKLTTDNIQDADWIYLPIFWTRWHVNHGWSVWGRDILQKYVDSLNLDTNKVFTVCQYDDGPIADLGNATVFLSSRKTDKGIDIPLLASPLERHNRWEDKNIFASFSGSSRTHPFRHRIWQSIMVRGTPNVPLYDGNYGTDHFIKLMEYSQIALCPRGYGGSSFRFYEAMQFGTVPFLIGDIDTRPFKQFIDWKSCSFYLDNPDHTGEFLEAVDQIELKKMSEKLPEAWEKIKYGKWCEYAIKQLN